MQMNEQLLTQKVVFISYFEAADLKYPVFSTHPMGLKRSPLSSKLKSAEVSLLRAKVVMLERSAKVDQTTWSKNG